MINLKNHSIGHMFVERRKQHISMKKYRDYSINTQREVNSNG